MYVIIPYLTKIYENNQKQVQKLTDLVNDLQTSNNQYAASKKKIELDLQSLQVRRMRVLYVVASISVL